MTTLFPKAIGTNLNYVWAHLLVHELIRCGVTFFCIAPGSRSAPLAVAVAQHPQAETCIHFDERGLAFYALGRVSATRQPTALICSSGTAAVNFFPAIVETSKKKLPLIILTADRPPELRHTGAMQTIDQVKLYGNYTRWAIDLPAPDPHIKPEVLLTTIDQAVFLAKHPMAGPVHLNCMFREPLHPEGKEEPINPAFNMDSYLDSLSHWFTHSKPYTTYTTGETINSLAHDNAIVEMLKQTKRGIIAVGKLASPAEENAVISLAEKLNWPIFPDIVSGLRIRKHSSPLIIPYYDQLLLSKKINTDFPVDTVLHLGGRITSKRFYHYIEKQQPNVYISVLSHALRNDPLHCVTHRIKSSVRDFCESVSTVLPGCPANDWLPVLQKASAQVDTIINDFLKPITSVNEIGVARSISSWLQEEHALFLSNSMPVREMDMYALPNAPRIPIGGNRGASGIDGVIATACGFAAAGNRDTTLLIGDLAFLHDLNSLALLKNLKKRLIIVVINNNGGGIFSFLPIAQSQEAASVYEPCFATPHGLHFQDAAKLFGLHYFAPQTMLGFSEVYAKALALNGSTIIEIKTNRRENHEQHKKLQDTIISALDRFLL